MITSEHLANPDWKLKWVLFVALTVVFSFGYYNLFKIAWILWMVCSLAGAFAFLFSWTEMEDRPYRVPIFFSITVADLVGQPIVFAILSTGQ